MPNCIGIGIIQNRVMLVVHWHSMMGVVYHIHAMGKSDAHYRILCKLIKGSSINPFLFSSGLVIKNTVYPDFFAVLILFVTLDVGLVG